MCIGYPNGISGSNETMTKKYTAIRAFCGSYFHQDWTADDPDEDAVIRRFLQESSREDIAEVHAELQQLLSEQNEDDITDAVMIEELWCDYPSQLTTESNWAWLQRIENKIGDAM